MAHIWLVGHNLQRALQQLAPHLGEEQLYCLGVGLNANVGQAMQQANQDKRPNPAAQLISEGRPDAYRSAWAAPEQKRAIALYVSSGPAGVVMRINSGHMHMQAELTWSR